MDRILFVHDTPDIVRIAMAVFADRNLEALHYPDYRSFVDGYHREEGLRPQVGWYELSENYQPQPRIDACITDLFIPSQGYGSFDEQSPIYPGGAFQKYTEPEILGVGVYARMKGFGIPAIICTDVDHHTPGPVELANKLIRAMGDELTDNCDKYSPVFWQMQVDRLIVMHEKGWHANAR